MYVLAAWALVGPLGPCGPGACGPPGPLWPPWATRRPGPNHKTPGADFQKCCCQKKLAELLAKTAAGTHKDCHKFLWKTCVVIVVHPLEQHRITKESRWRATTTGLPFKRDTKNTGKDGPWYPEVLLVSASPTSLRAQKLTCHVPEAIHLTVLLKAYI